MMNQARPFKIPSATVFSLSLFVESFRGHKLSKNKVQWLDLAFHLWPVVVGLLLARTIGVHYEISQIFKPWVDFFVELF
jgi:ABC-type molybdate transport system permease subunit